MAGSQAPKGRKLMGMTLVFSTFAAIAGLASLLLPHLASGLGVDMMFAYLALAALAALIGLLRGPAR